MAYSDKVLDHFENPRNVGKMDPTSLSVGTGLVGAPACGDVLKLQIKVDDDGVITDAKFKTYGCFTSNALINTPTHCKPISELAIGDNVLAWDGAKIRPNPITDIVKRSVPVDELLVVWFQRGESHRKNIKPGKFKLICTKEHIFWNADNTPILAGDIIAGQELYEITEYELRKITNIRHRDYIKQANSERMTEYNKTMDRSSLPQNQQGFVCKDPALRSLRSSEAAKRNWASPEYVKNWERGMESIDTHGITKLEQKFIDLFEINNVAVKYSAGSSWFQSDSGPVSPDFIVPGKKKCIEVYTKNMPLFMQDRSDGSDYVQKRSAQLKSAGYDTLFLAVEDFDSALERTQNFVHNGMEVLSVSPITHHNQLRGCDRDGDEVVVYDLKLQEGANVYFANRVGSHNCGSAVASSSLITEWVKGRTLEGAESIKNSEIVEELVLPPVKIHCSILAQDAIKAAVDDYREKNKKAGR
jgi:NifU-like protein involved in Fe-S cluster formation